MQLSANLQRRKPAPAFLDHTPRPFEISAPLSPSLSPDHVAGMPFTAGFSYTNAMMGQVPSAHQREAARKASSSILREDSIQVQSEASVFGESERPDSWSMHHDCTDQAPYSSATDDTMMTQSSILRLLKSSTSHDLAFFLMTTGPTAPHRRPSKLEHPKKASSAPKQALKFLKFGHRRTPTSVKSAHDELNMVLNDEGGLLLPKEVKQKVSSTGKKYLAITPKDKIAADAPKLSSDILESRVSISFADDFHATSNYEDWLYSNSKDRLCQRTPAPSRQVSPVLGAKEDNTVRMVFGSSPIRPEASSPPTPEPDSATSIAASYQVDLHDHPAKNSFDAGRALTSHPVQYRRSASSPMPTIAFPDEEFPVRLSSKKDVDIKHPCPRRFGSHPVLLQRASSIGSSMSLGETTESPGPPPPKSPLRLRRDPRSIEGMIHNELRKPTPKIAPVIASIDEQKAERDAPSVIIPSVVTECTGPIKRRTSTERATIRHPLYPASRKEREERIRQRKTRERATHRTIDSMINTEPTPERRLKKARPMIKIPGLKPAPLATRASSSASDASWRKVTQNTTKPVSPVPSEAEVQPAVEKTGYTPTSASVANDSPNSAKICLSPVMLVAEEVPVPKVKTPCKPARLILRGEGSKYVPRPRSASISRAALKRRSRSSISSISRPATPSSKRTCKEDTPPLPSPPPPSPPPNRALPPTPPQSGSEKLARAKTGSANNSPTEQKKELPIPPDFEILPLAPWITRQSRMVPHVATQDQRTSTSSRDSATQQAYLDALKKQNALLHAALKAVLLANGQYNSSPLASIYDLGGSDELKNTMAWENRVARRSAASHAPSGSNGSALDMYTSTRRGI